MYNSSLLVASFFVVVSGLPLTRDVQYDFELSVIHLNDFHARFEPVDYPTETICHANISECMGGFSRIYYLVNKLKGERPNPLVLNAGDNFQGTIWYNIFKWNATLHFMNLLPIDVHTLGNHEFDDGINGLVPFIEGLKAPLVVANIDDSKEPNFQGLYKKSIVLIIDGKRIGIIGAVTSTTVRSSRSENIIFLEESASVNEEADRLVAEENVDTIIVLSHCGYESDKIIARNASQKIGLIVGGHSHYFLYTGNNPPGPDKPHGDYPTVIEHEDGREILIVHTSSFTKYLGNITIYYDKNGNIVDWDGAPIFVDNSIPQDEMINSELEVWKSSLEVFKNRVIGETKVFLNYNKCWSAECNIGSFIADVMVWTFLQMTNHTTIPSKYAPIGLLNAGGIRSSIAKGNITYADLLTVHPYSNTWDYGYIKGKYIVEAIKATIGGQLMQFSGLRAVYNFKTKNVHSIKVKCNECPSEYEYLKPEQTYLVVVPSFFALGGDGLDNFAANLKNHTVGPSDVDSLKTYVKTFSPITQETDGRIIRDDNSIGDDTSSVGHHFNHWSFYCLPFFLFYLY